MTAPAPAAERDTADLAPVPANGRRRSGLRRAARWATAIVLALVLAIGVWLAPVVLARQVPVAVDPAVAADLVADVAYVEVDGAALPYRVEGEGDPVLLIHGGGPDMHTLRTLAAGLAADHRVITYNRRGYADAGPVATSWDEHRDDAAALIDQLELSGVTVVGISAGGLVALDLAVERPDLVGGLVVVEPLVRGRDHMTPGLLRTFLAVQLRRWFLPDEQAAAPYYRWIMGHHDGHSVWDRPDYPEHRKQLILRNAPAMFADIDNGDGAHLVARLDGISAPVAVVVGERSQRWFHRMVRSLQDELPRAQRIVVPGVGHAMTFEDPPATEAAIRQALTTVSPS
jgi:pimeloyl-ACP methyl ester carboxylesterase